MPAQQPQAPRSPGVRSVSRQSVVGASGANAGPGMFDEHTRLYSEDESESTGLIEQPVPANQRRIYMIGSAVILVLTIILLLLALLPH